MIQLPLPIKSRHVKVIKASPSCRDFTRVGGRTIDGRAVKNEEKSQNGFSEIYMEQAGLHF